MQRKQTVISQEARKRRRREEEEQSCDQPETSAADFTNFQCEEKQRKQSEVSLRCNWNSENKSRSQSGDLRPEEEEEEEEEEEQQRRRKHIRVTNRKLLNRVLGLFLKMDDTTPLPPGKISPLQTTDLVWGHVRRSVFGGDWRFQWNRH